MQAVYDNVIVPFDGAMSGRVALAPAADLAWRCGARVVIVNQLQADIAKLTAKASGRFGASAARAKLDDCQRELRLVLDRLGVDDLDDLSSPFTDAGSAVDPTVLDFARRECADAEQAFLEVAAMVIPDAEPATSDADADGEAEVIAATDSFAGDDAHLDLRIEPSAAS